MGEVQGKSVEVQDLRATLSLNLGRGGGGTRRGRPPPAPPQEKGSHALP